jgi:hypothetical protein
MFKLDPDPVFWSSVRLTVPGEAEPVGVEFQFAHKSVDDLRGWMEEIKDRAANDGTTIKQIVRGWRGVDADFSEDAVVRLVKNYPAAAVEIVEQYLRALTESRAKN